MSQYKNALAAVKNHIEVPDYIETCADAVRYDLLHGPAYALLPQGDIKQFNDDDLYGDSTSREDLESQKKQGDVVVSVFGIVRETLKEYIDEMPSEYYYDVESGEVFDSYLQMDVKEENPDYDEDDPYSEEFIEIENSYVQVDKNGIIEALFGKTIAGGIL